MAFRLPNVVPRPHPLSGLLTIFFDERRGMRPAWQAYSGLNYEKEDLGNSEQKQQNS